jgi:hypothetical protein
MFRFRKNRRKFSSIIQTESYDFVDVVGLARVHHVAGHDDGPLLAEDQTLHEVVVLAL